jgi:hypothetical protein
VTCLAFSIQHISRMSWNLGVHNRTLSLSLSLSLSSPLCFVWFYAISPIPQDSCFPVLEITDSGTPSELRIEQQMGWDSDM